MKTIIIAAVSRNGVIGRNSAIPWRYPADMKHFRRQTAGHPVLMGCRTFESLSRRPLPDRTNIVLTHRPDYAVPEGVVVCRTLEEARAHCEKIKAEKMFILGGAEIYRLALSETDEMVITHVPAEVEGDTFFPEWNPEEWQVVYSREEEGLHFVTYRRKEPGWID